MEFGANEHPDRRYNPLTGECVLVSPHRTQRPWRGQVEKPPAEERPAYEANCYLCPGNERAGGIRNPEYESTFVFTNDFSALLPDTPPARGEHPLLRYTSQQGTCRVGAMRQGDAEALGQLMDASHASLRNDFQVSSDELDAMVACARKEEGCLAARMTGAGFGGCGVALVRAGAAQVFARIVAACYEAATACHASIHICTADDGAEVYSKS